jgi:hypothetical protein
MRSLRPWHFALIALLLVLFLSISVLLARFLQTENVERDDVLAVLRSEAAGDAEGVIGRLDSCRFMPACVATARADAQRLHRAGEVKILSLTSSTAYSLAGATGDTRVAWTVIGRLPVVQCVRVRRRGSFLAGLQVSLLSLSAPIANEADC